MAGAASLVALATACGSTSGKPARGPKPRQPSATTVCPSWRAGAALSGFTTTDSQLPALSKTVLGRDVRYRKGAVEVRITSGVDVEAQLEDLDFDGYSTERGRREVRLLRSVVVSELLLASWHEPGVRGNCGVLSVVSHGLDETRLLSLVDDLTVVT
jgi:hypothetical protein